MGAGWLCTAAAHEETTTRPKRDLMRLRSVHTQRPRICSKMILHMTAPGFSIQNLLTGKTLATGGHRQLSSRANLEHHANLFPNSRFRSLTYYFKRHVLNISHLPSHLSYPPNSHPLSFYPPSTPPSSAPKKTPHANPSLFFPPRVIQKRKTPPL